MPVTQTDPAILACPLTGRTVKRVSLLRARAIINESHPLVARAPARRPPYGETEHVFLREDGLCAYPEVEGTPVLLAPERLTAPANRPVVDLTRPRYDEAYEEMDHYNRIAAQDRADIRKTGLYRSLEPLLAMDTEVRCRDFPHPRERWIETVCDGPSQWDAYRHLGRVRGQRVLQLGGKGLHAVKFLLAGAHEAWVVSPMIQELLCARDLAHTAGVGAGFRWVAGIAEELPFVDEAFDAVYAGASLHHTTTELAFGEIARILRRDGRFAGMDPWRAPLYRLGIALFGKREPNVHCRPLTEERVQPMSEMFRHSQSIQHGSLTRYPLLALGKLGMPLHRDLVWRCLEADDRLSSLIPGLRRWGSTVSLLAVK